MVSVETIQSNLEATYRKRTPQSRVAFERALASLPGGDTRSSMFDTPYPMFVSHGEGARLFDVDGNEYLDLVNNYTALIHGHAHPHIVRAISEQAARGACHGAPVELQTRFAEMISDRVPSMEQIRFGNSGTEAVLAAIRGARSFTGRARILKMEGGYHGQYDAAFVSMDPGPHPPDWPEGVPDGPGLSPGLTSEVLVAPFNDVVTTTSLIENHRHELAAVIVEPVLGAGGVIPADSEFPAAIRDATRSAGIVLIFDEIVTLRLAVGGAQATYGVIPDLTTLGKIIGGGLPIGAFGGRADIMAHFDPRRPGYAAHSGTFNGNAVTMAAGIASLELLTPEVIARINALGGRLRRGMSAALADAGVTATVQGIGSLATTCTWASTK